MPPNEQQANEPPAQPASAGGETTHGNVTEIIVGLVKERDELRNQLRAAIEEKWRTKLELTKLQRQIAESQAKWLLE